MARCVFAFESTVTIESNGQQYRAGRIDEVLLADLKQGDTFMIEAIGPDAIQAVEQVARLIPLLMKAEEKARRSPKPTGEILG